MISPGFENFQTPIKESGLVLTASFKKGEFDSHFVDGPFVFHQAGRYYMTYIGWDGAGYQTGLASSVDLLHWHKEGLIVGRGPKGSVTANNVALTCILRDNRLDGPGDLVKVNGHYLGTYHAYPNPGLEEGAAVIGLCTSQDLFHWELEPPILYPHEGAAWEAGGLYKSWIIKFKEKYYLFYNAKNQTEGTWHEQTGVATSTDLVNWTRYPGNPVIANGAAGEFDANFASDPCVFRYGDRWVMFYYGLARDGHARDGVAVSTDLFHWKKGGVVLDIGPAGSIDALYAHKPAMIMKDGQLYHFYCAVTLAEDLHQGDIEWGEVRGIGLAYSSTGKQY
jgi:predicted GH43/DUF377 family glycosyl hydrolase